LRALMQEAAVSKADAFPGIILHAAKFGEHEDRDRRRAFCGRRGGA
jgi:hypothetical protein